MKKEDLAVVFDWDGVIFNTALLKRVVARELKKIGCSEDLFEVSVRAAAADNGRGYTPLSHGKIIARKITCDPDEVARLIYRATERHPGDFVFQDARRLISFLKNKKHPFDILTAGNREFQEYKVERSGLRSMFRNVHTVRTAGNKITALKKLSRTHGQIYFLDDRQDIIKAVRRAPALKGKVLPVLVWRQKGKPPRGPAVMRRLSWRELQKIAIHNGFGPY